MNILVVADETWVTTDVEAALGESRYRITDASNPHDVVEACIDARADVVIADLQVGTMGGMAVVREIRAAVGAGDLPQTPTVLLLDRAADVFIAGRSGADGWLRKPFGAFELRDLLEELAPAAADTGTDSE